MTTRILPPEEYWRLAETGGALPWPPSAQVLVVEDGETVVGCWTLVPLYHVECLWIAPEHRKATGVARRLWLGMTRLVEAVGASFVLTAADHDDVRDMLAHAGADKLPGDHYRMRFSKESAPCLPS